MAAWLLRRQSDINFDAAGGTNTDAGLGSGNFLGMVLTLGHIETNLLVSGTVSGHGTDHFCELQSAILKPYQPGVTGSEAAASATPPLLPR